ncbi:hypothetical protein BCR36DRAFT_410519 [Piromyces finnis]|uniref:PH domain-containing protein n=1 Tax=Piromyces finnis TaxID=1754191 RepID=A0A1Y1VG69_9FUNG|nr:hypothetical protein BCR36DRAFT_410519 [Piromyces finnis]|eukprot:ORX54711.1 hypothetical protein BCR36DRAFT_410519 [Piromyces finnis]
MSLESVKSNVSIQLENWFEKHSRSYPRRWQKRYFRFDGDSLSYSKSDTLSERYKVNILDIIDVKMKPNIEGKYILIINIKPSDGGNEYENELEILMPNPQILKIWYNSIKECINSSSKLKEFNAISNCSINKFNNREVNIKMKSIDDIHSNVNKPLPQPNIFLKKDTNSSTVSENSLSNLERENKSLENINKKFHSEKSSVLSKLDALLGDLQHTMSLSEVERKSVIVFNNFERIGLSPLSNTIESSPLKKNCSIDDIKYESNPNSLNDKIPLDTSLGDKKINSGNPPEKIDTNRELRFSESSLTATTNKSYDNHINGNNRKNTIVNVSGTSERESNDLIADINKKINLNLHTDGMGSKSNSCVYNMAVNNYKENECDSRNNSGNFDNYNIIINTKLVNGMATSKSNNSSNNVCSPVVNKPKYLEVYTQFENSLTSSLDIVDIVIQILNISNNDIEMCYTDYKEAILTKSSDLINKSSNLFKQINDETRQRSSISVSETAIITKNPKMIEYGNELASIIRKIVSSLKIYLKIVKKDQLIQESEYELKSIINSEIESSKKTTISELKQSLNNLKDILLIIQKELNKIKN